MEEMVSLLPDGIDPALLLEDRVLLLEDRVLLVERVLLAEPVLLVIATTFSTLAPKLEKQLQVKGRRTAMMRAERVRWTKITTTTRSALEAEFNWSVLVTSCSFSQASWFAKKVPGH